MLLFLPILIENIFVFIISFNRIYPEINAQMIERQHHQLQAQQSNHEFLSNSFLKFNLEMNYHRIYPHDENRFFDCKWKAHNDITPYLFYAYPYLKYFNSHTTTDIFNGIASINNWPSLAYIRNLDNYNHTTSKVLLLIRGSDYGIHKSNLPIEVLDLINRNSNFSNDLLFAPDNFVIINPNDNIETGKLQAVCHNRMYIGNRYVSNEWQFFDNGKFWDMYDKLFTNPDGILNEDIILFGYSNGSSPRSQLMRMKNSNHVKDIRSLRLKSIIDIETNYDVPNLQNTVNFINLNIRPFPNRIYYAICASGDCPRSNHYELIKLLKLKPHIMDKKGFVSYQNESGKIVVDIIEENGEIRLTHSSVIPFGIKRFEEIYAH